MGKYLKIAFRNVIMNKRRSLFIGIAIMIGTMIMLLTASMSNGLRDNMMDNSLAFFTGHVNIYGYENIRGKQLETFSEFDEPNRIILEEIEGAEAVYRISSRGKMFNPAKEVASQSVQLIGIDIDNEERFRESIIVNEGDIDSIQQLGYAIIDVSIAEKFRLNLGDNFSYEALVNSDEYGMVKNTRDFTVGAITQIPSMGMNKPVFVSIESAKNFYMNDQLEASQILIYLDNEHNSTNIAKKIETSLTNAGYEIISDDESLLERAEEGTSNDELEEDEDENSESSQSSKMIKMLRKRFGMFNEKEDGFEMNITTWQEEISFMEDMIFTIDVISMFLNVILMTIILVGITNTLFMSIRERTYEIGTIRAIGMKRNSVLVMFMLEGLILGLVGTIAGIIVGGSISLIFSTVGIYIGPSPLSVFLINNTLYFKIGLELILTVTLAVVAVSIVASLYPSYNATKLKPITAMHRD
jgi:putative ABC transport system permease protein